jgi:hypothetical protein
MLYRPKFCSECGERIQRAEWRLTTSRQYCDLCSTEYPIMNRIPLLSVAICGLLLIVGAKTAFFPGAVDKPQPLVSQPVQNDSKGRVLKSQTSEKPNETSGSGSSNELPVDNPENASKTGSERVTSKDKNVEPIYYCGAPTKKGTPCSRRVKTKGYCFQHNKTDDR